MDTIMVFIVSVIYLLLAEVSGGLGITVLPIPATGTAIPVFNASACTVPGGDYSTCSPGYSMDCSGELGVTSKPCCFCPEGTYLGEYNNCTRCTAYTDCTGREIIFEGNITTDRRCSDWIKVTTVSGVLEGPTLPPPNATSILPKSSTGSPVLPADGTTRRGEPPVGEESTIFGWKTWVVTIAIVVALLLLFIFRKKISKVFCRCRGRGAEKTPMTGVPAEATDDVEQTEQLADAGANT